MLEKNTVCWNSRIAGYSCNYLIEKAGELFKVMPERNVASWSALISGYAENGHFAKALDTFDKVLISEQMPNQMTFSSVLLACANLCSIDKGKNLHDRIVKLGIQNEVFLGTALVDMYAKSGDIWSAMRMFSEVPEKNLVCWSAMIQGLTDNGYEDDSITLFDAMIRDGITPNDTPFLAVLFACSHRGLVDRGLQYFNSMEKVYGTCPRRNTTPASLIC